MSQELVLIGGMPAGGKTSIAKRYVEKGYVRLNRDAVGGNVDDLLPKLTMDLDAGKSVVMDNLYATRNSRSGAIAVANKKGVPVKFVLMDTSLEDAQFNACSRMMEKVGHVLHPDEHKQNPYKNDPNLFPVAVIYKYRKEFEKPSKEEGFDAILVEKFIRTYPADWVNKAVIFDFDGTLRTHDGDEKYPTSPDQVRAFVARKAKIMEYAKQGYILLGASNQSGIAKGKLTDADARACFDETLKQLEVKFEEVLYCPHKVPPITCYCRKPGPGMLVELIYRYKLDPKQSIFIGDMTSDKTCAARAGMKFVDHKEFFKPN